MKTFDEIMRMVEAGEFPEEPRVALGEAFRNDVGSILNVALGKFGGVALISSIAGSIRSNHYHKTDWHFLYVLSGSVHYYYRKAGPSGQEGKATPKLDIYRRGEMFFTPPMVEHAVYSASASEILSISLLARRHDTHEDDLVRVKLLTKEDGKLVTHR